MKYYVYTLARPDGTIFYVGKGCGNRVAHHEQEALRGHHCPKCNLIRSIWRAGGKVQRAIVFETEDERAALIHEMALINTYGPDQLVNLRGGSLFRSKPRRCIRHRPTTDEVFTELIDKLFTTNRKPNGKEYTYHEVSVSLNGKISPAYLGKLRSGQTTNPSRETLLLLCTFFKVPASYFFPELDSLEAKPSEDERINIALRSSTLSEDAQKHILDLIQLIRKK